MFYLVEHFIKSPLWSRAKAKENIVVIITCSAFRDCPSIAIKCVVVSANVSSLKLISSSRKAGLLCPFGRIDTVSLSVASMQTADERRARIEPDAILGSSSVSVMSSFIKQPIPESAKKKSCTRKAFSTSNFGRVHCFPCASSLVRDTQDGAAFIHLCCGDWWIHNE